MISGMAEHVLDCGPLETVGALGACDGVLEGKKGEWALDGYTLALDGEIV
jgi:hypothetical protein